MAEKRDKLPSRASDGDISEFLSKVAAMPPKAAGGVGRLIFALDATISREPTWDVASHIQAEMFSETAALGTLAVQLAYYRGFNQFHASRFHRDTAALLDEMTGVTCRGGRTQIERVLGHAKRQSERQRVNALVFVGDACEEPLDALCHRAGELGLLGVPAFMFHEGVDPLAARAFKEIAQLSGGAYCRFDSSSARTLRELLSAVAVYAVGGRRALEDYHRRAGREVLRIGYSRGT